MACIPTYRGRSGCGTGVLLIAILHRLLPTAGSHDPAAHVPIQFRASWRSPIFHMAIFRGDAA